MEEQVVVEDHLGRQEINARVHLLLEMHNIFQAGRALRMHFRVAGTADAEVVSGLLQLPDQLDGMLIIPAAPILIRHVRGNVTAKRHHIFDPRFMDLPDLLPDGIPGGGNACQMRHHRDIVLLLNIFGDIDRIVAGAAAHAVGHAHERRMKGGDPFRRASHRFK